MTSSIDIFGRSPKNRAPKQGPPGIGFHLNQFGDYDLRNRKITNLKDADNNSESVNLGTLKRKLDERVLVDETKNAWVSVSKRRLREVADPLELSDAINLDYFEKKALRTDEKGDAFDAKNLRITNVAGPNLTTDVINGETLLEALKLTKKLLHLELADLAIHLRREIHSISSLRLTPVAVRSHLNSIEGSLEKDWKTVLQLTQPLKVFSFAEVVKKTDSESEKFYNEWFESKDNRRVVPAGETKLPPAKG